MTLAVFFAMNITLVSQMVPSLIVNSYLFLQNDLLNTWINIALTWHEFEAQRLYFNGLEEPEITSYIQDEPVQVSINASDAVMVNDTGINATYGDNVTMAHSLLILGRKNDNDTDFGRFDIRHLVIWDRYIHKRHVHKLLGISGKFSSNLFSCQRQF